MPILIKGSGGGGTQKTPTLEVSSEGLITAKVDGEVVASKQLPTRVGGYVQPGTSNVTAIAAGTFATGYLYVSGDSDLVASNIKKGVEIFGVVGTLESGGTARVVSNPGASLSGTTLSVALGVDLGSDASKVLALGLYFSYYYTAGDTSTMFIVMSGGSSTTGQVEILTGLGGRWYKTFTVSGSSIHIDVSGMNIYGLYGSQVAGRVAVQP